ncbi:MAG TPA: EscN/YscN/HrcN family type III secretion system ATPase, partial [Spirochaetota bacterium]|nr:EscN/YscN/HrcN family type III secretion system ATPase [Spirochaetota bacterium]
SATRGYPPSVFSMMPKLLERAGTSSSGGSITGFYSVLVEGDDMNEPIADAARGILDGHIVLDRKFANRGHYPAVNILASVSRCMKDVVDEKHLKAAYTFRELLAAYTEAEDLINLGGYVRGANPVVDRAISMINEMNIFLKQGIYEQDYLAAIREKLISMMIPEETKVKSPSTVSKAPAFAQVLR